MRMKRKVVQHGPCTLTVSLPKEWADEHGVKRGDQLTIEDARNGLFVTTGKTITRPPTSIDLRNRIPIITKTIGALYRLGHSEITVRYATKEELQALHHHVSAGYIGFEIVDETDDTITIRKVSEPNEQEFVHMFRRIFHFLKMISEDGLEACAQSDVARCERLVLRDRNVDRLADFCRRVVGQQGQNEYRHDCALYHVIEQLEKIGDCYRDIHAYVAEREIALTEAETALYAEVHGLLGSFEDLFFSFTMKKATSFRDACYGFVEDASHVEETTQHHRAVYLLEQIPRELYNLLGSVLILNL